MTKSLILAIALVCCSAEATTPPRHFDPQQDGKSINEAYLDMVVRTFNKIHNGRELNLTVLRKLSAKEKADLAPLWADMGKAPHISRENDTLIFKFEQGSIRVRWPNVLVPRFYIENITWVFDPSAPLKWQLEMLHKKLLEGSGDNQKSALLEFLLPRANADAATAIETSLFKRIVTHGAWKWIGGLMGGAFLGTMGSSMLPDGTCWALQGVHAENVFTYCAAWKTASDNYKKATVAALLKDRDKTIDWTFDSADCSPATDSKPGTFNVWIVQIQNKGSAAKQIWKEDGSWFQFTGQFDIKNQPTAALILSPGQKVSDPDLEENANTVFVFNPLLESIKFQKRPMLSEMSPEEKLLAYDPTDPSDSKFMTISMLDPEKDIPLEYRDRAIKMKAFIDAASDLYVHCVTEKRHELFHRQKVDPTAIPTAVPEGSVPAK